MQTNFAALAPVGQNPAETMERIKQTMESAELKYSVALQAVV